jgi:hypothetical protein
MVGGVAADARCWRGWVRDDDDDDGEDPSPSSETGWPDGPDLYPPPPLGDLHGGIEGARPPIHQRKTLLRWCECMLRRHGCHEIEDVGEDDGATNGDEKPT